MLLERRFARGTLRGRSDDRTPRRDPRPSARASASSRRSRASTLDVWRRRGDVPDRRLRLRQDDAAALHQPARRDRCRRASGSTASCSASREQGGRLYRLSEREIARQRLKTGMVFQRFNLFPHMTALENITEGPLQVHGRKSGEARAEALELLRRVGLADKADCVSRAALRRPAAARGDRARAGHEADADAVRRADQRARSRSSSARCSRS